MIAMIDGDRGIDGGSEDGHIPVLLDELTSILNIDKSGLYIDCTGGGGGHAKKVLESLGLNGRLVVMDRDADAYERLNRLFFNESRVSIVHTEFSRVKELRNVAFINNANGIYADLGVSSFFFTDAHRGFSFRYTSPLDMRMDQSQTLTAHHVVNTYSGDELIRVIKDYGEEQFSRNIVSHILKARLNRPIDTTSELANIIEAAIPRKFIKKGIHPATKTFQAIRIEVNNELGELDMLLDAMFEILAVGGVGAIITFHSLEDRMVKARLNNWASACICPPNFPLCVCGKEPLVKVLTKKPILPTSEEVLYNNKSRSAKLRAFRKVKEAN